MHGENIVYQNNVYQNIVYQNMVYQNIVYQNIVYQNPRSPLQQKQEISNTARCLETAFYILIFCVLTFHLYFNFNLNIFSNTIHQLTVT